MAAICSGGRSCAGRSLRDIFRTSFGERGEVRMARSTETRATANIHHRRGCFATRRRLAVVTALIEFMMAALRMYSTRVYRLKYELQYYVRISTSSYYSADSADCSSPLACVLEIGPSLHFARLLREGFYCNNCRKHMTHARGVPASLKRRTCVCFSQAVADVLMRPVEKHSCTE